MDKNKWGPYAWHLLHRISIQNKNIIKEKYKIYYYNLFKSFSYILPCELCRDHYYDIINYINPLELEKINRKYIIIWLNKTHNIINDFINKPQYKIIDTLKYHEITNNKQIFIFLNGVYENISNLSIIDYDNIYNFFKCLSILYPDKVIRNELRKIIKTEEFKNLKTTNELKNWYKKNRCKWQVKY